MSIVSLPDQRRRPSRAPLPAFQQFRSYCNIIYALMMHDIKNRFFGSGLGQIVLVLWPFVHILVLMVIYIVTKRPNPYGESLVQYTAVSIYPFICFNYVSRWIVYSAASNKSFLQYPIIKPLDLLVGRALLEVVSISLVGIMLVVFVVALGDNPIPADPAQAAYAVLATLFLAISMGILNGTIAMVFPMWMIIYMLFIILAWVASGAAFIPAFMPEQIRGPLSYNPLLQCTEWMRTAYYPDYPTMVLDRIYVLKFSLITLTAGLVLERLVRRFVH